MCALNPIPSGFQLQSDWQSSTPPNVPVMPASWTAAVLLSPFGDSVAPMGNYSQLAVATIESSFTAVESWMRVRLSLTRDHTYFDFAFVNVNRPGQSPRYEWYWIDSTPAGQVKKIFGPFSTTLQIPGTGLFTDNDTRWGNSYPLMCTDTNPRGIECDHWVLRTPGAADHGSWYAFRRDTGNLFRIFNMDCTNPQMIPILGSYYIVNIGHFALNTSKQSTEIFALIKSGAAAPHAGYWNPMVTQEDIQRAIATPLASADSTAEEIQSVIPGFSAMPSGVALPQWTDKTYIEGWTLGTDFIPYFTRVCYLWTGDADSKQQTVFIGQGPTGGEGSYLKRTDTCLNTQRTDQPYLEWNNGAKTWELKKCLDPLPGVGLPFPDWLARDGGVAMGQIIGNPSFGLAPGQVLNLVAAELQRGKGELAIFWVWFLGNGTGMLFSEGNFMNSMSHNLQLIDYNLFLRNAPVTSADFSNPCGVAAERRVAPVSGVLGHLMRMGSV